MTKAEFGRYAKLGPVRFASQWLEIRMYYKSE